MRSRVVSGIRCKANPDESLRAILPRWIGCQRFVYNAKVEEDRLFAAQWRMERRHHPLSKIPTPLDQTYAHFKSDDLTPWLSEVPSQVLRNGAFRRMTAKQRQLKGTAKAPRKRNPWDFDSVLLTSELFRFVVLRSEAELAYELDGLSDEELQSKTLGIDRNVSANKLATSDGKFHDLREVEALRLARKEKRLRKYQRKMARQVKGSANRRKTARKVARMQAYGGDLRKDFAHRTSRSLVDAGYGLYVFEKLNVRGMTKKPKARQDEDGSFLPNGRAAKSGLAKSILASAWGLTETYVRYKAARRNALVVSVDPRNSSRECAVCGHVAKENRKGSRFKCVSCGHEDHADANASRVVKRRGIALIRSEVLEKDTGKAKRKVSFRRKPQVCEGSDRPGLSVETAEDQALPSGRAGGGRRSGNRSLPEETSSSA